MVLIQTFSDGSLLTFDSGAFDSWCVYLQRPNQPRHAPTDVQYFSQLLALGATHGNEKIYNDFVTIYNLTTRSVDKKVLNLIHQLSEAYGNNRLEIEILLTIIYAGMVAEENKEHAILRKRIKRLGLHQTLMEKVPPAVAANFSRGKNWKELDHICISKGF